MAGYKNTYLTYGFDADGYIKDITYFIDGDGREAYNSMQSKLTEKYGKPLLDTSLFPTESSWIMAEDDAVTKNSINSFSGWVIKYDDCYISLELINHKAILGTKTCYFVSIGYGIVTYDEYQAMLDKINQYAQSVEESVNNDL